MKEGSFVILGRGLDTLSGCKVCFVFRWWWWPSSSHELPYSARPQAWSLCSETRICYTAFSRPNPTPPHNLARAVASSPASSLHTQVSILQVAVTSNCASSRNIKFPGGTEVIGKEAGRENLTEQPHGMQLQDIYVNCQSELSSLRFLVSLWSIPTAFL